MNPIALNIKFWSMYRHIQENHTIHTVSPPVKWRPAGLFHPENGFSWQDRRGVKAPISRNKRLKDSNCAVYHGFLWIENLVRTRVRERNTLILTVPGSDHFRDPMQKALRYHVWEITMWKKMRREKYLVVQIPVQKKYRRKINVYYKNH